MSFLISSFGNRIIQIVAAFFGAMGLIFIIFFVIFPKNNTSAVKKYSRNFKSFYVPDTVINDIFI